MIYVLAIDVYGVGNKRGPTIAAPCVPLFKAEEFQLGLDAVEKVLTHDCGWTRNTELNVWKEAANGCSK